jgi:hypothetical protein
MAWGKVYLVTQYMLIVIDFKILVMPVTTAGLSVSLLAESVVSIMWCGLHVMNSECFTARM